tara:strand:- start:3936 stop:5261 length:1326 start_codon:yes stop_codon:yes gene_type:complete
LADIVNLFEIIGVVNNLQSLRGMVDLLPAQTWRWQKIESLAREHFLRAALKEVRTPLIELTELFSRGIGEGTDVVGKEMYTFIDRGERSCTLRPEGTASVVRAVIQHGMLGQGPQRLWYGGPMFRYERPQAGRQRQFHQIGVEFFGLDSIESDAELISIGWDFLKELGVKDLRLELNSLGTTEDRKQYRKIFVSWLEERFDLLDEDSKQRINSNPLRIFDSKNIETKKILSEAPILLDALCVESIQRFEKVQEVLSTIRVPFELNPRLVRGLDYYCHTAFEITSDQLGAQATVCGGGRYDGLVEQLGGPITPSIGWAIGVERLILLLEKTSFNEPSPDIYFVKKGNCAGIKALFLARQLRQANLSIEIDYSDAAFSKQFKRASRSGASFALVLGENEISKGEVRLKCLKLTKDMNPEELLFSISNTNDLINYLQNSINGFP